MGFCGTNCCWFLSSKMALGGSPNFTMWPRRLRSRTGVTPTIRAVTKTSLILVRTEPFYVSGMPFRPVESQSALKGQLKEQSPMRGSGDTFGDTLFRKRVRLSAFECTPSDECKYFISGSLCHSLRVDAILCKSGKIGLKIRHP